MKPDRAERNGRAETEKCDALRLRMQQQRNVPLQALVTGSMGAPEHVEIVQFDPSMAIVCDDRHAPERPFAQVQQAVAARQLQAWQRGRRRDDERGDGHDECRDNRPADRSPGTARDDHGADDRAGAERAHSGPESESGRQRKKRDQRTDNRTGCVRGENGANGRPAFAFDFTLFLHQRGQHQSEQHARHQQCPSRQQSEMRSRG